MGFVHSQIYLYNKETESLLPQIHTDDAKPVDPSMKDNPFVQYLNRDAAKLSMLNLRAKATPSWSRYGARITASVGR